VNSSWPAHKTVLTLASERTDLFGPRQIWIIFQEEENQEDLEKVLKKLPFQLFSNFFYGKQ